MENVIPFMSNVSPCEGISPRLLRMNPARVWYSSDSGGSRLNVSLRSAISHRPDISYTPGCTSRAVSRRLSCSSCMSPEYLLHEVFERYQSGGSSNSSPPQWPLSAFGKESAHHLRWRAGFQARISRALSPLSSWTWDEKLAHMYISRSSLSMSSR